MPRKLSFDLFLAVWNAQQNLDTPEVHLEMGRWLAQQTRTQRKRLLLMAFRGCGKSTLTGLFCAWLLLHDPELRILVVSADEALAEHMLRHVRQILESHPLTRKLCPVKKSLWSKDRLLVKRKTVSRDPSVRAAGLHSNITGARADIIICDDVEVPKTSETEWKRQILRQRLAELDFILTPEGMILYIGTPHTEDSLYKVDGYLSDYARLEIPLHDNVWPERFGAQRIAQLQQAIGSRVYASQMLLQPTRLQDARLDIGQIQFYDEPPETTMQKCYWDPAFGYENGDSSVLVLVLFDHQNNIYVQDVRYLMLDARKDVDAASQQCIQVAEFLQNYHLRSITIESNGLGQFLPGLLRKTLREKHYACAVQLMHNTKPKTQRILEAFEARLAARAIHLSDHLRTSRLLTEMSDWQPENKRSRDDGIDAVAGAIALHAPSPMTAFKQFFIQQDDYHE